MAAGGDEGDLAGAAVAGAKNFYLQKFKLYETRSVSGVIFLVDFVLLCFCLIYLNAEAHIGC